VAPWRSRSKGRFIGDKQRGGGGNSVTTAGGGRERMLCQLPWGEQKPMSHEEANLKSMGGLMQTSGSQLIFAIQFGGFWCKTLDGDS
jgi:hypothetical protein